MNFQKTFSGLLKLLKIILKRSVTLLFAIHLPFKKT